jgi:hypothetical protein
VCFYIYHQLANLQAAAGVSAQLATTAAEVTRLQTVGTTATSVATSAAAATAALRLLARAAAPALQRCSALQAHCAALSTLVLPSAAGSAQEQRATAAVTLLHELQELSGAMGISTASSSSSGAAVQLQCKWSLRAVVVCVLACNRLQRLLDTSSSSAAQRTHQRMSKRSSSRQRDTAPLQLLPDSAVNEHIDSDALAAAVAVAAASTRSRFTDNGYSAESQAVLQVLEVLLTDSKATETAGVAAADSPFSGYCSDGFSGGAEHGSSGSSKKRTTGYKSSSGSGSRKSLLTCLAKGLTQHHARLAKRGIVVHYGSSNSSSTSSSVAAALPLVTAVRAGFVKLARRVSALEVCCNTYWYYTVLFLINHRYYCLCMMHFEAVQYLHARFSIHWSYCISAYCLQHFKLLALALTARI